MKSRLFLTLSISLVGLMLIASAAQAVKQSSSQATSNITPKPSQQCIETLAPALKTLGMNSIDDLKNKNNLKKFIKKYSKTSEWEKFDAMCRPPATTETLDIPKYPWYCYIFALDLSLCADVKH